MVYTGKSRIPDWRSIPILDPKLKPQTATGLVSEGCSCSPCFIACTVCKGPWLLKFDQSEAESGLNLHAALDSGLSCSRCVAGWIVARRQACSVWYLIWHRSLLGSSRAGICAPSALFADSTLASATSKRAGPKYLESRTEWTRLHSLARPRDSARELGSF